MNVPESVPPIALSGSSTPSGRRPRSRAFHVSVGGLRAACAVGGVLIFILALQTIKAGARDLLPVLEQLDVRGPLNAVGFGWLFAYVVLSGSPVAAIGISLLAGGVFSESEAFAVVGGSRLGAAFIVLAVGFVTYLRGRRSPDGLSIGVIALVTTFTTQGPAILLGLVVLHFGWLDGVRFDTPASLLNVIDTVYGPPVDAFSAILPGVGLFIGGVVILMGSFWLFDRALPQLESEASSVQRALHVLHRRPLMFLMGCLVTLTTLSVSISITVLVPLALKGYIRKDHIIPYVMGANITTFVDTLVGSVLLGGDTAFTVVLTEMLSVAVISIGVLAFAYGPYSRAILAVAGWATAKPRHLGAFLGAIVAVPAVLLFL